MSIKNSISYENFIEKLYFHKTQHWYVFTWITVKTKTIWTQQIFPITTFGTFVNSTFKPFALETASLLCQTKLLGPWYAGTIRPTCRFWNRKTDNNRDYDYWRRNYFGGGGVFKFYLFFRISSKIRIRRKEPNFRADPNSF